MNADERDDLERRFLAAVEALQHDLLVVINKHAGAGPAVQRTALLEVLGVIVEHHGPRDRAGVLLALEQLGLYLAADSQRPQ